MNFSSQSCTSISKIFVKRMHIRIGCFGSIWLGSLRICFFCPHPWWIFIYKLVKILTLNLIITLNLTFFSLIFLFSSTPSTTTFFSLSFFSSSLFFFFLLACVDVPITLLLNPIAIQFSFSRLSIMLPLITPPKLHWIAICLDNFPICASKLFMETYVFLLVATWLCIISCCSWHTFRKLSWVESMNPLRVSFNTDNFLWSAWDSWSAPWPVFKVWLLFLHMKLGWSFNLGLYMLECGLHLWKFSYWTSALSTFGTQLPFKFTPPHKSHLRVWIWLTLQEANCLVRASN